MALAGWLNALWMLKARPERRALARSTQRVAATQQTLLLRILAANRAAQFGTRHGFATIRSVQDFQSRVPLSTYADYRDSIERIAVGEPRVLTTEPVQLLEPTGGSTGGEKLVPYTAGLRREFQRGVAAWTADLLEHYPAARAGRAYWSISPAWGPARRTAGGVPIGFDDDTAYLARLERFVLPQLLAVPAGVARLADVQTFRYVTLAYLLAAGDLSLISVWNPSFLTQLVEPLSTWIDSITRDLHDGRLRPPGGDGPLDLPAGVRWSDDRRRAREIETIWNSSLGPGQSLARLWPKLALISCWCDAAAQLALPAVRELFPHVAIQPKGLLATEGFISLPLTGFAAPALALRSHFFEFLAAETRQPERTVECHLAHQLERGGRYRVVLTTSGGFYRYQLQDEVEIVDFWNQCPLLRFVGKVDRTSDLVGEKLAESHVQQALAAALANRQIVARFAMLVPAIDRPPRYRLYLQAEGLAPRDLDQLARELDAGLMSNRQYRYALDLGQLARSEIIRLPTDVDAWGIFEARCVARGQRLGNIKPAALDSATDWPQRFAALAATAPPAPSVDECSATPPEPTARH